MWVRKQQYPCQPICLVPKRRQKAICLPSPQIYTYPCQPPPPPTSPPLNPTSRVTRRTGLLLAPLALAALLVAAASLLDPGSPVAAQSDGSTEPSSCATEARQARSERTGLDFSYYPGFNTHTDNGSPRGIWSDGTTLWIGDSSDTKFYAYHLRDATGVNPYGSRDSGKDIEGVTGETQYITGDDNYIWTGDRFGSSTGSFPNGGIYAYNRSDLSRAADKDFTFRPVSTDTTVLTATGMASDGSHFWIANSFSTARAFRLSDDPDTEADEYGTWDESRDITFSFEISGLHIDGDVIWAINSGGAGKAEARRLSDGARLPDLDVDFGNLDATREGVWYNGVTIFVLDRGNDKVFTYRTQDNGAGLALTPALTPGQAGLGLRADLSGFSDPDGIPDDAVYRYQWLRDCQPIMGATGASYQPTEADAEAQLTLRLSYTDAAGQDEEVFADAEEEEGADTVIAVPWHWELTPPSQRAEGSEFRLLFLTDTGHAPGSTKIADYNAYVQQQVSLEGSPASLKPAGGFFRVLASTADVGAHDNTATNFTADEPVEIPTYWLSPDGSGQTVADSYQQLVATTRANAGDPPSWNSEDAARLRTGELIGSPTAKLAVLTGSLNTGLGLSGETLGSDKVAVGHLNAGQTTAETPMGPAATGSGVAKTTTAHRYYALSPVFRVVEGRPGETVVSDGPCRPNTLLCATFERMRPPARNSVVPRSFTIEGEGYQLLSFLSTLVEPEEATSFRPSGWHFQFKIAFQDRSQLETVGVVDPALFKDLILEVNGIPLDLGRPSAVDAEGCWIEEGSDCQQYRFYGLPINLIPLNEQVPLQIYPPGLLDRTLLVSYDSPLNSGELDGGELFRVMFVTYLDHTAPFCAPRPGAPVDQRCGVDSRRTIEEYNAFVQQQARLGGWWRNPIGGARRSSGFRALVSTDRMDARDNTFTRFVYSDDDDDTNDELGMPIYWLQGKKLADNYQDFYDGTWSNPAAGRDGWGHPFDLTHFEVATGSRDDGAVDPTGFMGESGGDVVRAGPGEGGLQGASLLDVGQGLRIYALSPIFEVRKAQPKFTVEVQTESWNRDPDTREAGDLTIHVNATHPAGRVNGAQIGRWEIEGRSLSIFERETFQADRTVLTSNTARSATWENVTAGGWYALRVTAFWDQGSWNSGWFYARAGTGLRYALDPDSAQRTALVRAELPQTKPGGVRGLSASAGETGVVLSWRAPADNGDGHPVFYRIERALTPGQWEELEPGTLETTWSDPSPPESGNVFYRVAAYNAAGAGPWLGAALQLASADPNTPATGAPTISGTAQVGETLTADTTGIDDADGLDNVSYSYQWVASDTDILDATNSTYVLAEGDDGKAIKVKVTFEDDAGNGETLTSAATAAVAPAPAATPLTASHEDAPASHDGQTSFTFKLRFSEEVALSYVTLQDHAFTVTGGTVDKAQRLTPGSNTGWTITATPGSDADVILALPVTTDCAANGAVCTDGGKQLSAALTLTVPGLEPLEQNSPATGAPTINGTARVDQTLTASTSGINDEDGLVNVSYGYQWQADGSDIAGATAATYTLTEDDQGKAIKVRVSFADDAGNEETLTGAATSPVAARPNNPATGAPAIGGTAQVGETLTANPSGIRDDDGLESAAFSYQWLADDTDIADATGSAYTLADADEGKAIKVKVTFDDDDGNEETLTSAATTEVVAAPSPLTARFEDQPSSHDGQTAFTFELHFSEEFGVSYATLRDHAFSVTGGSVSKAQRLTQGSNLGWRITVTPGSDAEVSVVLPETTDCDDQGAVCTGDGRMLSNRNEFTLSGS